MRGDGVGGWSRQGVVRAIHSDTSGGVCVLNSRRHLFASSPFLCTSSGGCKCSCWRILRQPASWPDRQQSTSPAFSFFPFGVPAAARMLTSRTPVSLTLPPLRITTCNTRTRRCRSLSPPTNTTRAARCTTRVYLCVTNPRSYRDGVEFLGIGNCLILLVLLFGS